MEAMIRKQLPTLVTPTLQAAPKDMDRDILVRQLIEMISPPMRVAQERPPTNDVETPLFNRYPMGTVTEGDSTEGCFSCGEGTPDPSDGKRQLVRGEGLVARTSNAYRICQTPTPND